MKSQKCFANDYFVSIAQWLAIAGQEATAAVDEGAICRAKIFNEVLAVASHDSRMTPRHFRFRIVGIQIDLGEDTTVGIPSPDLRLFFGQGKLLPGRTPALDH